MGDPGPQNFLTPPSSSNTWVSSAFGPVGARTGATAANCATSYGWWRERITTLATCPNVVVPKVVSFLARARPRLRPGPLGQYRRSGDPGRWWVQLVEHLAARFGPEGSVGSNYPVDQTHATQRIWWVRSQTSSMIVILLVERISPTTARRSIGSMPQTTWPPARRRGSQGASRYRSPGNQPNQRAGPGVRNYHVTTHRAGAHLNSQGLCSGQRHNENLSEPQVSGTRQPGAARGEQQDQGHGCVR